MKLMKEEGVVLTNKPIVPILLVGIIVWSVPALFFSVNPYSEIYIIPLSIVLITSFIMFYMGYLKQPRTVGINDQGLIFRFPLFRKRIASWDELKDITINDEKYEHWYDRNLIEAGVRLKTGENWIVTREIARAVIREQSRPMPNIGMIHT